MKPFTRSDRVAGLLKQVLSDILQKKIKDPRLQMITITSIKMSKDLRLARIYFIISGDRKEIEATNQGLKNALGYIKRALAREVDLRYIPDLRFYYDESFDYGSRIDKILNSLKSDDRSNHMPSKEQ
ncbi:MAG: 30S ribosome-binding factor RbfA [Desulfobacterales bacterium]|nr:30S ribosome-binding factor RbfA [Desulfobacterales bacterium]